MSGELKNFEPFFYTQAVGLEKIPIGILEKLQKVRSKFQSNCGSPATLDP